MRRWVIASLLLTLAAAGASAYVYAFRFAQLPDEVPIHWGINFEPDQWVSKHDLWPTFVLLPAAMLGLVGLALVLAWMSPKHFEVETFSATYGYCMFLAVALIGYIHFLLMFVSFEQPVWFGRLLVAGIFVCFALIGNVLGKVRRSFWVGVRTPWTLASEGVWNGTHRFAAWVFVIVGVAGAAAVLLGVPGIVCFVGLMAAVLLTVVYSFILYKRLEREGRL